MKIRENLVSNSSSTSFIIAFKDSKPCPHCGRKDPSIVNLIGHVGSSNRDRVDAVGVADVKQYIRDNFYVDHDTRAAEIISDMKKHEAREDWNFAVIRISYGNEEIKEILDDGIASGDIVELYEDAE